MLTGLALVVAVSSQQLPQEFKATHFGAEIRVVIRAADSSMPHAAHAAHAAAAKAFERIAQIESIFVGDSSELRRLEARPRQTVAVSKELFNVLHRALQIAEATEAAFDPTIGVAAQLWREARASRNPPEPADIIAARTTVGWWFVTADSSRGQRNVRLSIPGMRLDLTGVARAYALERAARVLRGFDVTIETDGLSIGGGKVTATSPPLSEYVLIGGSGRMYSPIVDPRTSVALSVPYEATVTARDAITAYALAQALPVLGPDNAPRILARFPKVKASVR